MEQIFQAHGAVRVELSRFAFVIHCDNTRAARVAMHVIIVAFDTAQSALVAMVIISLGSVIKEVARGTKVGGELDAACNVATRLRHRLSRVTSVAHHFFDCISVHFMCLGIVVAVPTHVRFMATGGHQAASSNIVFALRYHFRVLLMLNRGSDSGGGRSMSMNRSRSRSRGPCPTLHLLHFRVNRSNPFAARLLRLRPQFNAAFPGGLVRIP